MRTMKTILTLTIIVSSTFVANADPVTSVGPSAVPANGTPVVATASAPYVTVTPSAADESHIATTAYVKGAYNDAIAAVNKVNSEKQTLLFNASADLQIRSEVVDCGEFVDFLASGDSLNRDYDEYLVSGSAVRDGIKSQRVKIYTTWDDDRNSATTQVPLETFVPED